ncbi:MAG: hypothetical protein OI715_01200 (plasmid) [Candidatus Methanoperedens sp.]|nr:MAG: hypothetical protein OI715_01200 [Candidatus Methanoperedens sp.]
MIYTEKKIDEKPSRAEMIAFLRGHFRYYTMNSWNRSTSYARNVKIHKLDLTREQRSRAYNLIYAEDAFMEINDRIRMFDEEHDYKYQASFNGRSSGYIVLLQGGKEPSGYRSFCTRCGQMNYKLVMPPVENPEDEARSFIRVKNWWIPEVYPEIEEIKKLRLTTERVLEIVAQVKAEKAEYTADDFCGRCSKHGRQNFTTPHMRIFTQGIGMDEDPDFENEDEWSDKDFKRRYDLIKSFDKMVDDCIEIFKGLCDNYEAVEEEVPCTRKVIVMKEIARKEGEE